MAPVMTRGDCLFQAHSAPAAVVKNPEQFDQVGKQRFSKVSLSYPSTPGASSRSKSPGSADVALHNYDMRWMKLHNAWLASFPMGQFDAQVREERGRIERAREFVGIGNSSLSLAGDRVRQRWIEQGIWDYKWYEANVKKHGPRVRNDPLHDAQWMHEVPPEDDSETEDCPPVPFYYGPKKKRQKTDEEVRQSAERRAERLRQRELSRPIHQFNYQMSRERDRLLKERAQETANGDPVKEDTSDIKTQDIKTQDIKTQDINTQYINTQAYTTVKDKWVKAGLWIDDWGILPGMTWLCERDFNELVQELGPRPTPRPAAPARRKTPPAPRIRIFSELSPNVVGNSNKVRL